MKINNNHSIIDRLCYTHTQHTQTHTHSHKMYKMGFVEQQHKINNNIIITVLSLFTIDYAEL